VTEATAPGVPEVPDVPDERCRATTAPVPARASAATVTEDTMMAVLPRDRAVPPAGGNVLPGGPWVPGKAGGGPPG
jgi:hypothetical protein